MSVKYAPPRLQKTVMGREGGSTFGSSIPGMKSTVSDAPGPGWIEGDDVVIRSDMILNATPLGRAPGGEAAQRRRPDDLRSQSISVKKVEVHAC